MDRRAAGRRGAYARSLAAIASIAARADAFTRRALALVSSHGAIAASSHCAQTTDEGTARGLPQPEALAAPSFGGGDRHRFWTETVGRRASVYGERWTGRTEDGPLRRETRRSKLSAAIVHGWSGPVPTPGKRWLYLGAASGTTASRTSRTWSGRPGRVYAVERSLRPFARLLSLAERWPNLLPILGDARAPDRLCGARSAGRRDVRRHRAG